jgi:hypothetical protein
LWCTYIHQNGNNHELGVEADQRLILGQLVLLDQSLLDGSKEVPVETCIDQEDDDFGKAVPDFVDTDESALVSAYSGLDEEADNLRVIDRGNSMRWDPNNKDGNVHKSDENSCAPFQLEDCRSMFGDDRNSVDDNLHKQLDLEDPKEQNEEENRDTVRG